MIECIDAGYMHYSEALEWQRALTEKRRAQKIGDHLLLLEHPPVYTMGKRDSSEDLLMPEDWIARQGIAIFKAERGGRITYHGPGQLVGYMIFQIKDSIPALVWKIEEVILRVLAHFQVEGDRDPDYPGIWIKDKKISALGLHVSRGVTMHGFSLNVSCDLRPFQYIHPCGIKDRGVTTLEKELGWRPSMRDVKQTVLEKFAETFKSKVVLVGSAGVYSE